MCLALGYPHPDHLMEDLSAEQFNDWVVFNKVQPIGKERLDYYFAHLMASMYNLTISVHGKKGAKKFKIEEFYPNWAGVKIDEEPMSINQIADAFRAMATEGHINIKETRGKYKGKKFDDIK